MNATGKFAPPRLFPHCPLVLAALLLAGCGGAPPEDLGVEGGQLKPCPATPNCVSTRTEEDPEHRMKTIPFRSNPKQAMKAVAATVERAPRAEVVRQDDGYLRAEFTSRIFRFVDDVELSIDERDRLISFRSASRLGESDLGVNRDRMTKLSKDLRARLKD